MRKQTRKPMTHGLLIMDPKILPVNATLIPRSAKVVAMPVVYVSERKRL